VKGSTGFYSNTFWGNFLLVVLVGASVHRFAWGLIMLLKWSWLFQTCLCCRWDSE